MRIHRDERGQTIILVAFSLPLLLGFVGIATDVGALFKAKRTMQTAADAAAIAAALNLNFGSTASNAAAVAAATANGYVNGSNGVTVTPHNPPSRGSYNGVTPGFVEVDITKTESTIFLSLFGYPSVTVSARAVATNQATGSGCLYTVGTTGTTFTNNGNVTINAPGCGLVVESSGTPAMLVHGNTHITLGSIGVVGTYSKTGGSGNVSPTPVTGIAPASDPLNYLPQYSFTSTTTGKGKSAVTTYSVSCASGYDCSNSPISVPMTCATTGSGVYSVAPGATLTPGCYAGLTFPSSGTVTVNPGLYLVAGDLTLGNGTINGSGVTFYWGNVVGSSNGNISFGGGTYNLSAPNDATQLFNGVLLAESISDSNGITFGGNSGTVISGVVYAPNTSFDMHGTPGITLNADFVVHDITLSGTPNFTSYAALSGVSNPLTSVALVE